MKEKVLLFVIIILLAGCFSVPEDEFVGVGNPERIRRGQELVQGFAACGQCHGAKPVPESPLIGGAEFQDLYGPVYAANLTPSVSGIGSWNFSDFLRAIRQMKRPDGALLSSEFHQGLRWMADEDLLSIFAYLQQLQPVKNEVPKRDVGFWEKNTLGLMEGRPTLTGFIPKPKITSKIEAGRYIVDNVASCGSCHNKPGNFFRSSEYLGGGKVMIKNGVEKVVPSVTPTDLNGLGAWSKKDLIAYLATGKAPDGNTSNPDFCPVNFFPHASVEEIEAVVEYLKSAG